MKYVDTLIGFREVPNEISLCINISNCPNHCKGCHSPYLWEDTGTELNIETLQQLIKDNSGITCICLMGGDAEIKEIQELAKWIKTNTSLKVCWYSGKKLQDIEYKNFDYIKTGAYIESLGGLDSPTTNQRFYEIRKVEGKNYPYYILEDITYEFRKKN